MSGTCFSTRCWAHQAHSVYATHLTRSSHQSHKPCFLSSNAPYTYPLHLQVSVGGRDNFLAAESDKTLTMMVDSCSEIKVAQALLAHAQHKSPQVRAKIASHLDSLVQGDSGMRLASEITITFFENRIF